MSIRISFNSARFMTSASKAAECPTDEGLEVAFAGRSNAGKSSAINTITNNSKLARTSKTPGRTQLINFFSLSVPGSRLVDLPGYGFAKVSKEMKDDWQRHLAHYLENRKSLQALVLVMDIRHPCTDFDNMMLQWAEDSELPVIVLATKADKLKPGASKNAAQSIKKELKKYQSVKAVVRFSSLQKTGVDDAQEIISEYLIIPQENAEETESEGN